MSDRAKLRDLGDYWGLGKVEGAILRKLIRDAHFELFSSSTSSISSRSSTIGVKNGSS